MNNLRHFIKETDFTSEEVDALFRSASDFKALRLNHRSKPLLGQSWGMLFFKNSTRTRISFDVGLQELGAHSVFLDQKSMQLSRGETVADTAKVVSRYLHGMIIRAYDHSLLEEFAKEGSIPVINALTDFLHPCQLYADVFSIAEKLNQDGSPGLKDLKGRKVVFFGDCNSNMANSWILGGCHLGMEVVLCGPKRFAPGEAIRTEVDKQHLPGTWSFCEDPVVACNNADVLYTDVWVSMGDEDEAAERKKALAPYQVTLSLLQRAKPGALFMHCLPAHAEEEVSTEVLSGQQSIIFDQAENRLHMQKAIMAKLANQSH
jgi:ornithine carbamoyltransferase